MGSRVEGLGGLALETCTGFQAWISQDPGFEGFEPDLISTHGTIYGSGSGQAESLPLPQLSPAPE